MITVEQARKLISEHFKKGSFENVPLGQAVGRVLAQAVIAEIDVPQFDNSAMDGYAFQYQSLQKQPLTIVGESAAGSPSLRQIEVGEAARVFTGAMVPQGADTVVMQEKVRVENGNLWVEDNGLLKGGNVRLKGSQTPKGAVALEAGVVLTPGAIGFLAGLGVTTVQVCARPKVALMITGNEIVPPGSVLKAGEVFECNSYSLSAALYPLGIQTKVSFCPDDFEATKRLIEQQLSDTDLLLITGGVSVGDYDFVVPALEQCGVQKLFHKVAQKPAKPLFAGVHGEKMVFGLPGNPASVLTSFYVYVLPWLRHFLGTEIQVENNAIFEGEFQRKPGLTQFLKAHCNEGKVALTSGQESYRMDGFAIANCLIEMDENMSQINDGDRVKIIPF
ncbi:MAG: molybdopterin molybdotransferase MoeA [Bacteroidia bacterium]|nr:molybdopterin molybdotransferase MoeA [Bacteroidia bacterium]